MLPDSEQQTRAWQIMLRGEMEHAMAQHTRFMEEQTRTIMSEIAGSLLAQVREMSGAIGQRVHALEVQASQADELVAHRLAPAQFTAMAQRQANTEMRLRHAEEQVRAQEERTGARKIHVDKVAAQFEAKVCTLQQLVDMQSGRLREMREQTDVAGHVARGDGARHGAAHSVHGGANTDPAISDIIVPRGGPRVVVCGGCTGRFGLDAVPRLASPCIVHRVRRARPRG